MFSLSDKSIWNELVWDAPDIRSNLHDPHAWAFILAAPRRVLYHVWKKTREDRRGAKEKKGNNPIL